MVGCHQLITARRVGRVDISQGARKRGATQTHQHQHHYINIIKDVVSWKQIKASVWHRDFVFLQKFITKISLMRMLKAKKTTLSSFIQIRGKRSVRMRSLYSLVDWNLATFNLITSDINFNKGNTNGNWFHIQTDIQSQKRQKKTWKKNIIIKINENDQLCLKSKSSIKNNLCQKYCDSHFVTAGVLLLCFIIVSGMS